MVIALRDDALTVVDKSLSGCTHSADGAGEGVGAGVSC